MDILTFLILLRVPILNNHALNWCVVLLVSWLTQRKLILKNENPYRPYLRIVTALVALMFLVGISEIFFDPFWIIKIHMPLQTYFWNMWLTSFFYTGIIFGMVFFKFKRVWLVSLIILVNVVWFLRGLHLPMGLFFGDVTYYMDFEANLFDVFQACVSFIVGYFMINGFRLWNPQK